MRYETAVPIGRGAEGEVFKALDPLTGRTVALKLFPEGAPTERREREARAQAGLSHPSICDIYEVGTTASGRGFIAMRHVDGEPLDTVCARLPIRRRIELVAQIADAVGVAHEAGLVHRDLKPSNLLVEEQEDHTQRAFVLDFGIVRVASATRLTETGQVLGTPGYLSPEQARGEEVDARSDVFSLGVLLYQVLTGRLPFTGTGVEALLQVLDSEPPPAHTLVPGLPSELSHITAKAMEKDARRRYPDAAALQRDLQRYLHGAAPAARRVGVVGRWMRRVERRPELGIGALLVALLVVGFLAWGTFSRLRAERQTREAEIFARRATEIEAQARYAELLPRHSIDARRRALLREVERLSADVERSEGRSAAAGFYAVGRAERALGQAERATLSLDRARRAGFDEPALALDQALALLEGVRSRFREVELLRDAETRRTLKARLRQELRQRLPVLSVPAKLGSKEASVGATDLGETSTDGLHEGDRWMIQALDAFLAGRNLEARELARRLVESEPWRIEADLLLADTYRDEASSTFGGEDSDATERALDEEQEVLARALERAPSAVELYRRLCENRLTSARAKLALGRPATQWESGFDDAQAACDRAAEVSSSSLAPAALGLEVRWRRILARSSRRGHAEDLLPEARQISAAARRLLDHPQAGYGEHQNLGNALLAEAQVLREMGRPSPQRYEEAAQALSAGLAVAPESAFGWQSLGIAWTRHGQALDADGEDPRASYDRAVAALERGLNGVASAEARVWNSICMASNESAYYGSRHLEETDPLSVDRALDRAEKACGESLTRAPDYVSALSNLGLVLWTRVEWEIVQGRDPSASFATARDTFERLFELSPQHVSGRINFAGMTASAAAYAVDRALELPPQARRLEAVMADLADARQGIEPLLERIPFDTAVNLSRLRTLEAAVQCASGRPSQAAFDTAQQALERLSEDGGWLGLKLQLRARFHLRRAECRRQEQGVITAGNGPRGTGRLDGVAAEDVAAGLEAVEQALDLDPSSTEAAQIRERLTNL